MLHGPGFAHHLATTGLDGLTGGIGIGHLQGDVAVGRPQLIGLHTPVVGQFKHGTGGLFLIADEGQRELAFRVVITTQQAHPEDFGVKSDGAVEIDDAEHGVKQAHGELPCFRGREDPPLPA